MRALAILLVLSGPAGAQDAVAPAGSDAGGAPYDETVLTACLQGRTGLRDRSGCIGIATQHCQDHLPTGAEAMSFASCHQAEEAQWGARLEDSLALYREALLASDRAEGVAPGGGRLDLLDASQAAWQAYVTAECDLQLKLYEGSGAEPVATAACRSALVAARALGVEQDQLLQEGA